MVPFQYMVVPLHNALEALRVGDYPIYVKIDGQREQKFNNPRWSVRDAACYDELWELRPEGPGWDMRNVNRVLVRWIVSIIVVVCAVFGVRGLIVLKERRHEQRVGMVEQLRAERQTFDTMLCVSRCLDNYLAAGNELPIPISEVELWEFSMESDGLSPFCAWADKDRVSALQDGWGRTFRIMLGPENMLYVISAGADGVFQTDFEDPHPNNPKNATPENDDMICDVVSAPSILNSRVN